MNKLLGPHLGGQWANKLDVLRTWQPPFVLVLQPEVEKVHQLRSACPNAFIVGRFYHDDNHYASNIAARPKEFAREMHQEIVSNPVTPLLDYVQSNNEVCQDWHGIQKLNEYTQEWMHLADQSGAYKCAILAFSVGNPDLPHKPGDPAGFEGRMLYWQQVLPSLNYAQRKNHLLLLHAYGYPNVFAPDADWFIYRYERQVEANLRTLGITTLQYAYGEIGIDRLIVNNKGGYKVVTTDQDYVNQLLQWERNLQGQSLLLGGAIFTFGDSGGWDTYDITSGSAASLIAEHYATHANEYKSLPDTGASEPMQTHLPSVGTGKPTEPSLPPREWDARLTQRGVTIETSQVAPGQQFWRVVKARWYDEQEADALGPDHHIMIDTVVDRARVTNLPVRIQWPSDSATIRTEAKTGEQYATGYGMSPSRNEFSVWVDDGVPSEIVKGIGMGAETPSGFNAGIHTSTGVVFQLVTMPAASKPIEAPTTAEPVAVPQLVHPIRDPALRVISQRFGENPQNYARFGLKGHSGLDFAVPVGTPICAVDDGEPIEIGDGSGDYGIYVKMRHAWGESLYAHLSLAQPMTRTPKGAIIGLSGNSGNSTGPHLHLGIRVNPYTRGAPFDGYSDPLPYLDKVSVPPKPLPRMTPDGLVALIKAAAQEFGADWQLLASLAWAESSFNPTAVSAVGALGLCQIMPATWAEWGTKIRAGNDPFDPYHNLRVGAAYLAWLNKQVSGNDYKTMHAYVFGIGNVVNGVPIPDEAYDYADKVVHGRDLLKAVGA